MPFHAVPLSCLWSLLVSHFTDLFFFFFSFCVCVFLFKTLTTSYLASRLHTVHTFKDFTFHSTIFLPRIAAHFLFFHYSQRIILPHVYACSVGRSSLSTPETPLCSFHASMHTRFPVHSSYFSMMSCLSYFRASLLSSFHVPFLIFMQCLL